MQASRLEATLRTWSLMAARCQKAEAQELIRATAELNQQLMDRCKEVPLESGLHGMVLSIRAAFSAAARLQLRSAFDDLAVHARLAAIQQVRRHTAARRMARALVQPNARLCSLGGSP